MSFNNSNQHNPFILLEAAASIIHQGSDGATESNNPEPETEQAKKKSKLVPTDREQDIVEFKKAVIEGDVKTVDRLLNVRHLHPGVCNNTGIILAAKHGRLNICKRLMEDSRTNPTDQKNYAIRMAVKNGHHEILKLMLEHSKSDPSADNNYPIPEK